MYTLRNNVQLIGHLGSNPIITKLKDGNKMARLTIATHDTYTNEKGETFRETQWHQVVAWSKKAQLAEYYLTKGNKVCIEGKLSKSSYIDNNGVKRFFTEIICQKLLMLGPK